MIVPYETLKSMHLGPIADPKGIANAIVSLLFDRTSFVLGHTLLVDGAYTCPAIAYAKQYGNALAKKKDIEK